MHLIAIRFLDGRILRMLIDGDAVNTSDGAYMGIDVLKSPMNLDIKDKNVESSADSTQLYVP